MSLTTSRTMAGKSSWAARGDLAGDHDEAGLGQGLAGHAAGLVGLDARVEHGVGHLVAKLVGMAFGDALGSEKILGHGTLLPAVLRTRSFPAGLPHVNDDSGLADRFG